MKQRWRVVYERRKQCLPSVEQFPRKPQEHGRSKNIGIFCLTLFYKEKDGSLTLEEQDYKFTKKIFPALYPDFKGMRFARIEAMNKEGLAKRTENPAIPPQRVPCQAKWSDALRMELVDMQGKCLHFAAASRGTFYVLFSAVSLVCDIIS